MKLLDFYRSRKYFMRLLISFTLLVSVFLIVFCSLLYSYSKNNAMKLQQEATVKVLRQVNYNIDNLYATVTNLTVATFSDRDIAVLLKSDDMDIFELYNRLQKFDYIPNTNLFVDSIVIYNSHNGCYYTSPRTIPVQCDAEPDANLIQQYTSKHAAIPNLKLLPNRVVEKGSERQVLTMFEQEQGSILMVNVKPSWLFDNISAINGLADNMLGEMMIIGSDNEPISLRQNDKQAIDVAQDEAQDGIMKKIQERNDKEGHFVIGSGKHKQMVMYITSQATGWKLMGVQSYDIVFGGLSQIGTFAFLLLFCFIVLSLIASTAIAMKLYKPIGSLIQAVRGMPDSHHESMGSGKDELTFLTMFNQRMLEKMAKLETGKKATGNIAKDYLLRRLLLERKQMSEQEFAEQIRLNGMNVAQQEGAYIVCLLSISETYKGGKPADYYVHRFAVQNIADELASSFAMNESLMLGDDIVALLLSASADEADRLENALPEFIGKLQDVMRGYYHVGLCASVSSVVRHHEGIAQAYEQAELQFEYRMIYGKTAFLTPGRIAVNERSEEVQLDDQTEKRWMECVRGASRKAIEPQLVQMFDRLSTFRHDHLLQSLQYLTAITVNMLKEMNVDKAPSVKAALLTFNRRVLEQETLDDMLVLYTDLFEKIADSRQTATEDKNRVLASALKEAIEKHFADPNLSLQFLAAKLKMSTAHLSKVFKQNESVSVNDYVNKVRIMKAAEQLLNTDMTIAQIMYNVGFVSESYFYKTFKQSIGLTPREFRTKQMLSEE